MDKTKINKVTIIGAGMAGVEAAWALAERGVKVQLFEMRPNVMTPAHRTGSFAELVCSNSFKSNLPTSPAGQLKWEMEQLGSVLMPIANKHSVPAGQALAVERDAFADEVTHQIENHPNITVIREEVTEIPTDRPLIIASGPLTSEKLHQKIAELTGQEYLYFYDAVSPCVTTESIDMSIAFKQSRYDKGETSDYINCPFNKEEYERFYSELMSAELTPLRDFEKPQFFEGCLPIEEVARRGMKSLSFGPMKPVGLTDPRTERRPYAVMQLRPENREGTLYSLVACQTRMKWDDQRKVFQMVPGLANADFVRLGVIHRNTYLQSPQLLNEYLELKDNNGIYFAGQMTGVEGYLESAAMGIIAGINIAREVLGVERMPVPDDSVIGSLIRYITQAPADRFAPMNANWGLFPELENPPRDKAVKREILLEKARTAVNEYRETIIV